MQKNLLRRLALIVAFALLTAAGAQAFRRIGASPIPVSLGLLAVFFTGAALPKKDALFSQVLYLLLVIAGLPFYSGFLGGMQVVTAMTGGFVIAYPLVAVIVSLSVERFGRGFWQYLFAMTGSLLAYFALGFGQLLAVSGMGIPAAFSMAVKPFLLPDLCIALAGAAICWIVRKAASKMGKSH